MIVHTYETNLTLSKHDNNHHNHNHNRNYNISSFTIVVVISHCLLYTSIGQMTEPRQPVPANAREML